MEAYATKNLEFLFASFEVDYEACHGLLGLGGGGGGGGNFDQNLIHYFCPCMRKLVTSYNYMNYMSVEVYKTRSRYG